MNYRRDAAGVNRVLSNNPLERTAGSQSLAAAAQRQR